MSVPNTVSPPLTLSLLGPMHVLVQGQPLPHLRSRKTLWLLALLTLRHGRPVEREWLAGTLWPDVDQSQAFANLRPTLSELRKVLGDESKRLLSPSRHTLQLDLAGARVDVHAFDAAMTSKKPSELEQAVALYRGPLLEGCTEEWVGQERIVREQQCLHALEQLGDAALTAGDYGAAVGYYQRAMSLDPLWDTARRGAMEALVRSGDRNAALQVYRDFVELLRSDPNAVPDEATTALYQRLRAEARQRANAPGVVVREPVAREVVPPAVSGYLPHPLTGLVGREEERLEVATQLRRSRLVTLTGPGGIGKTRLAIETAREIAPSYGDGVWFVALDALSEGKLVVQQIAVVLGLQEESGRSLLASVTEHLRKKRLLLVLDNCEHLLEASAQIVAPILQECAGVRILATSREALGLTGESVWRVPSLAVPDPNHLPKGSATLVRVLLAYESVQLFIERARAVQKTFVLTGSNALAVAQVCGRLEGIPLAIELAAARVRAMMVEQILVRLDDHLSLLTGGNRTALPRQQTLRATLDWSYALLTEAEQVLLRRVAVFAGGWTLEAVEGICSGENIAAEQVLDLLTSLVDKSLVVFEAIGPNGDGRYRFLEPVQQYAAERLQTSQELATVKSRHRDWFLVLAEEARMIGPDAERVLQRLETEHDNLRAAVAWCAVDLWGAEPGLRLTGTLWRFWNLRGHYSEGRKLLDEALNHAQAKGRTSARAKALNGAGLLATSQADYAAAQPLLQESLSIARELQDRRSIAFATGNLGSVVYRQGEYAVAQTLHNESLSLYRELGDRLGVARTLNGLGNIASHQGEYRLARALFEESLSIRRELEDQQGIALAANNLGHLLFEQGESGAARALFEESLRIRRELGDRRGTAITLGNVGNMAVREGDYAAACAMYEESLSLHRELGDRSGVAHMLNCLGNVASRQGNYIYAQTLCEESLSLHRELGEERGIAQSLEHLGEVAYAQGKFPEARTLFEASFNVREEFGDKHAITRSLEGLAVVRMAQGEVQQAVRLWGASQALREHVGTPMFGSERETRDRQLEHARTILGETVYTVAWTEGATGTWEQTVASALHEKMKRA